MLLDREEAIRSRTPTEVQQELWGIFLAYNLVRPELSRPTIPKHLRNIRASLKTLILPPRRAERRSREP